MREALFTHRTDGKKVQCLLCPHSCIIAEGATGICRVRKNTEGTLYTLSYGKISALHLDPIEKKPLYHFYPGTMILSAGSVGCNLRCIFCQNHEISQYDTDAFSSLHEFTPEQLANKAFAIKSNTGLAFTYNEPVVGYEFVYDTAQLVQVKGLKTVMVSNGYIQPEALEKLIPFIDAWNVDLKSFDNNFYKTYTLSSLAPVLETLKLINRARKHLEITNLIIPGLNDDPIIFERMVRWISKELGSATVLHLSRYFPRYKLSLQPTPPSTLQRLKKIAETELQFVYLGNL